MAYKRSFFVAGMVAVAALTSTAHAMPFSDNFNDGNADGWFEIDASGGLGSFDASSGAYHLTTDAATPVSPGGGLLIPVWTDSFADPSAFSNGFVRAIVEVGTEGTSAGVALRLNPAALTGYVVNASTNADTFELLRIDGVSGGALQEDLIGGVLAPGLFPFDPGNRWNIELGAVADRISMKVWRVGDLEPDLAQITAIDSTYTTGNLALFALRGTGATGTGTVDATFDNVRFRPTPEPLTASMGLIGLAVLGMSTCRRRG